MSVIVIVPQIATQFLLSLNFMVESHIFAIHGYVVTCKKSLQPYDQFIS
jgi:hypothetical protein